jgi:hypothetical protein
MLKLLEYCYFDQTADDFSGQVSEVLTISALGHAPIGE